MAVGEIPCENTEPFFTFPKRIFCLFAPGDVAANADSTGNLPVTQERGAAYFTNDSDSIPADKFINKRPE